MKNLKVRDVWRTCNKISSAIFRVNLNLWDYFGTFDTAKHGVISETKFVAVLNGPLRLVLDLSESEIADITDYFRLSDGRIHYSQLCKIIHGNVPELKSQDTITGLEWEDPLEVNRLSHTELRKLNLILTQIAININKRHLMLRPYFQDYELVAKSAGTVSITHFGRILNHLGIVLASSEFALLVKRFSKNTYTINYVSFIQAIEECQNFMDQHGMLDVSGELLDQFPGRIITADLPKLPRLEIGKLHPSDVFGKQSIFHPALKKQTEPMPLLEIIRRIQKHVLERRLRVREFLQNFDSLNVGRVTISQFKRGLDALQVSSLGQLYLSELEIDELVNFYKDPNDLERVLWRVFEDDINHVFTVKELDKLPQLEIKSPPQDIIELPHRGLIPWQYVQPNLRELCEETIQKIRYRVTERQIMIKEFFKNYDKLNHGHVTRNQVRQIFTAAALLLSPEEIFALEQRYNDEMGFNYVLFIQELEAAPITTPLYETMLNELRTLNDETPKSQSNNEIKDIAQILAKIKTKLVQERIQIKDYLRQYDRRNETVISRNDFIRGLSQLRCVLSSDELEIIMDTYKAPLRPDFIDYVRFCRTIEEAFTIESLEKSPLLIPLPHVPSEATSRAFLNFEERQMVSNVMDKLIKVQNPNLDEIFQDFDKQHTGTVTKNQLVKVLSIRKILPLISNKELDALHKCFGVECRDNTLAINYRSFLRALDLVRENKRYLPF